MDDGAAAPLARPEAPLSAGSLVADRRFGPMFWTQFSGAFNDNFFKNALVILVTYKGATAFGLSAAAFAPLASAVFILPFFIFSAIGGQLADKHEKSGLIRATKLAEIAIMGLGAIGLFLGQIELLVVVLFLMGTQSAFFGPVKYGILPQLLEREKLVGGNALVETATYLAILTGTIFGGVLINVEWGGQAVGVWIVAVGVVLAALAGWGVSRGIPECEATNPALQVRWDPFSTTWEIIQITRAKRPVWLSILGITWFWGFGACFLSLFPNYTKEVLGGGETIATLFLAVFSVGIGLGSMFCERLSKQRLELGLVPLGSIGLSLFTFALAAIGQPWQPDPQHLIGLGEFLTNPWGLAIVFCLLGIAGSGGLYIVPLYTMIQQRSDDSERSRVIAGNNIVNSAFMVGANLVLMALVAAGVPIPWLFAVLAACNALVAIYVYTVVPEFLLRMGAWLLSNVMYQVEVRGLANLPQDKAAVLVCNHVSFADWLLLAGAIQTPLRFVMYAGFNKGLFAWFAKQAKVIPIASKTEDPVAFERAFDQIHEELVGDWMVAIFPEGKLTGDGEIGEFKKGVEHILARDPVPVVPMALNGMWGSSFSRKDGPALRKPPRRMFGKVTITIGEPVPPEQVTAELLREKVLALWKAGGAP
jgi:1-acyl-sn-glycerol-3-phosphate acyltransferase